MNAAYRLLITGLIAWVVLLAVPGPGATRPAPDSFADLVEKLTPAVVNIASVSSFIAQPKFIPYNSSKGALLQLTKCLALDLSEYGIRVNCVCPGSIYTPATERHIKFEGADREAFLKSAAEGSF